MEDQGCLEIRSECVRLPVRPEARSESSQAEHEAAELQAIRIGDLTVIGVPGELFAQTALDVRANNPHHGTIIAGLANGDLGYLPPPAAYAQGGYEVEPHARSRFDQRAELMVKQAIGRLLAVGK